MADFSEALVAVKNGKKAYRTNWNGKDQWVRLFQPYNENKFKITELPGAIGTLANHLVIRTVDNQIVPWLASQSDLLANDWVVEDYIEEDTEETEEEK